MTARETQLVVLGGGPGGYSAAFRAADLGVDTIIVERYRQLGGVCLNMGCIPSKTLLHVARVITECKELGAFGVDFQEPRLDLEKLHERNNVVLNRLGGGLSRLARQRKVTVLQSEASFISPTELSCVSPSGETQGVKFKTAIIACGSRPSTLGFMPDDPRILDSTSALDIRRIPERLLIIGGGVIGLEMACIYDALGSKVTVLEASGQLLPGCDPDLVAPLAKRIERRYERVLTNVTVTAVDAEQEALFVSWEKDGEQHKESFGALLVAVGRLPNSDLLGLEQAGVETTTNGFIPCDEQLRTNIPNIHAVGDVTPGPMLAHRAMHQGKVAAEVVAGENRSFRPYAIPGVAYTDPEVAWVGLSESAARTQNIPIEVGTFPWAASGRALGMARSEGLTKIIREPDSGRLLGAGIVGVHAGELIAELTHALEMGADTQDLALTIHPHPTLSETVGLAAEVCEKTITDLPRA